MTTRKAQDEPIPVDGLEASDDIVLDFRVIEDAGEDGITGVFGKPRLAGDNKSNEHPSLYEKDDITGTSTGYPIQQAFYYNNRLGFLSRDNVILSQAGDHYNFYFVYL